jgi:hypothetical protein
MTDTSELHQRLAKIAQSYGGYIGVDNKELWVEMFEQIEKEVAAQKQRWEAEARKDELVQMGNVEFDDVPMDIIHWRYNRMAALDGVIGEARNEANS